MFGESITKITINFLAIVITFVTLIKWLWTGDLQGAIQVASVLTPVFTVLAGCYTAGTSYKRKYNQNGGDGPSIKKDTSVTNYKSGRQGS